jgi:hypothetical protein
MRKLSRTKQDDLISSGFNSCKSLPYPEGSPFIIDIMATRLLDATAAFARINSSESGFFFCGIRLEVDE